MKWKDDMAKNSGRSELHLGKVRSTNKEKTENKVCTPVDRFHSICMLSLTADNVTSLHSNVFVVTVPLIDIIIIIIIMFIIIMFIIIIFCFITTDQLNPQRVGEER